MGGVAELLLLRKHFPPHRPRQAVQEAPSGSVRLAIDARVKRAPSRSAIKPYAIMWVDCVWCMVSLSTGGGCTRHLIGYRVDRTPRPISKKREA